MQKSENIVSYTMDEIKERRKKFGSKTDWARVAAITEEELEASIDKEEEGEFDFDDPGLWYKSRGMPKPKQQITMRFDGEIIDWFKAQGPRYQTRMNAVLRNYIYDQQEKERSK